MIDIHGSNDIETQVQKSAQAYAKGKATAAGDGIAKKLMESGNSFAEQFAIKHADMTDTGAYSSDVATEQDMAVLNTNEVASNSYEEAKEDADKVDKKMTKEDEAYLDGMGMSLEKYTAKQLDELVDTIKKIRENTQQSIENQVTKIQEVASQFDDMSKLSDEDVADLLRAADIPVNAANINKLAHTLEMAAVIPSISNETKVYMVDNNSPLTIAEFYKASYSSAGIAIGTGASDDVFESLRVSIGAVATTAKQMDDARWLLDNGLAINEETLKQISDINDIQENYNTTNGVAFIIDSMKAGEDPAKASLLSMRAGMAFQAINIMEARSFAEDSESFADIIKGMKELRVQLLADLYGVDDEIKMASKSIMEEANEALPAQISDLEGLENASMTVLSGQAAMDKATKEIYERFEVAVKTMNTVWAYGDLKITNKDETDKLDADAYGSELKLNNYSQALDRYEEGQTQIRTDLGDSMKKAFAGIESLLETEGINNTKENVAATKLLGYAGLDITEENIQDMKEHMLKVSTTFEALKPAVVVKMVKDGINPLEMNFDELKETADKIAVELGQTSEEKYSEYLYRLDQNSQISEDERKAYIGIYRLIKAVEGTDNAAIATTVKAGRDFTMANLLCAVRTLRGNGIDQRVDDEFGGIDKIAGNIAIDEQIVAAASTVKRELADNAVADYTYENILVTQTEQRLSDGSLLTPGVDNIREIVNTELEELAFVDNNNENAYIKAAAPDNFNIHSMKENIQENTVEFLEGNGIELSVENMALANDFVKAVPMLDYDEKLENKILNTLRSTGDEDETDSLNALSNIYEEEMNRLESEQSELVMSQEEYSEANNITMKMRKISFVKKLSRNQVYEVPVKDASGNDMNVKMAFKSGTKSQVEVALNSESLGRVKAVATVEREEISVSVLSDSMKGVDILKENNSELVDALAAEVDMNVTVNYARMQTGEAVDLSGMVKGTRMSQSADSESGVDATTRMDTKKLCQMAGALIEYIRKAC